MRKKIQKATAVALAASMTVGLAACGGGSEAKETGKTEKEEKSTVEVNETGYPITSEEITVTAAGPMPSGCEDWTQLAVIEEYAKRLGIRLDCELFQTDWETQLTLKVAGDELPDLLMGAGMNVSDVNEWGGEGYFLDLSKYLDLMPNLSAYFEEYPEMKAYCTTSEGNIYGLPRMKVDMTDRLTRSFINRQWLENLNLEVPATLDEYYDVLVLKSRTPMEMEIPMMKYRCCSLHRQADMMRLRRHFWMLLAYLPAIRNIYYRQMKIIRWNWRISATPTRNI